MTAEDVKMTGVFVTNLPFRTTEDKLSEFVSESLGYEDKPKVHFFRMQNGKMRGTAMVYFSDPDEAQKCVQELNDREFEGRLLGFREDREPDRAAFTESKSVNHLSERQVFVGNMAWTTDWRQLKDHMGQVGEVEFCATLTNREGRPSGNALVRFKTAEDAQRAIQELHNTNLGGRDILVREDRDGKEIDQLIRKVEYALHVGNVDKSLTWNALKDHFRDYKPTHVDVGDMRDGKNRGYGVVKFARRQDALDAKKDLDGTTLGSGNIFVKWDRNSP